MNQSRRTPRNLRSLSLLFTFFFLVGGQAAFATWYPVYQDDEYMGCTYVDPLDSSNDHSENMGELGCWLFYAIDNGLHVPPPTPGRTFANAADFGKYFDLTSDSKVGKATAASAAEMRRRAKSLQAEALELTKTADATEALTSTALLARWLKEQ